MTPQRFAIAARDELWVGGRLLERRLSHGQALTSGQEIVAGDVRDDSLVAACDAAIESMRQYVVGDARVRLVAEATLNGVRKTLTVRMGERSIVTAPEHFADDLALLRTILSLQPDPTAALGPLPLIWKHGSAAVLLHEAVGHPAEHGQEPVVLPRWLAVEVAFAMRRASFKDVPLQRMTSVVATQSAAPFRLPQERIEILLVDGGAYDPLTELVTIRIGAADLVTGGQTRRLRAFELSALRADVARSLAGASGETVRYPGVICSREGQELVVESHAPVVVTEGLNAR